MSDELNMSSVTADPAPETAGKRAAPEEKPPKTPGKRAGLIIGIAAAVLVLAYAGCCVAANALYSHTAFPNTSVLGMDMSGLSAQEAEQRWTEQGSALLDGMTIRLTRDGQEIGSTTLSDLGVTVLPVYVSKAAGCDVQDRGWGSDVTAFLRGGWRFIESWFRAVDVTPQLDVDEAKLTAACEQLSDTVGCTVTDGGYRLARQAGHTLVEPVPSLVSLVSRDPDCKKMMGLALKNVTLTLLEDGKAIFDEQGEMLFTHFGISGPLTLSASSHLGDMKKHKYHAEIDLKPALSEEQLYDRITRDFALLANHAAQGALVKLLPSSMQPVMVARWGIDPATKANQITREQKRELVQLVKHWQVSIDARGDLAHAVITSGGVSVREVDPKTMQSKKALGLYFAGEVLDVDAYTGGYNLQIAFCTAQSFANNL